MLNKQVLSQNDVLNYRSGNPRKTSVQNSRWRRYPEIMAHMDPMEPAADTFDLTNFKELAECLVTTFPIHAHEINIQDNHEAVLTKFFSSSGS
jgi:hypothetical protein